MGMDSGSRVGIWETKKDRHCCTDPPAFRFGQADHSPMDRSGFAIARILNQYNIFGIHRVVNFYSQKCSPAEQNHDTYDLELIAIVEKLKH